MRASAASAGSRAARVDRARDAHRERGRALRFRAPGRRARCSSAAARRGACRTRCGGARGAAPAASARRIRPAEPSMQSSRVSDHHLEDRRDAAAFVADAPRPARRRTRPRSTRWSSRRACPSGAGCGSRCCVPSGRKRGSRKQRQPAVGLRQHEERVAHRRREEPLVADELVARRRACQRQSRAWCWRARRSRPASRSCPCRSCSRASPPSARCAGRSRATSIRGSHSRRERRAAGAAPAPPHSVIVSGQLVPRLGLVVQVAQRRARDVRAGRSRVAPREARARRAAMPSCISRC